MENTRSESPKFQISTKQKFDVYTYDIFISCKTAKFPNPPSFKKNIIELNKNLPPSDPSLSLSGFQRFPASTRSWNQPAFQKLLGNYQGTSHPWCSITSKLSPRASHDRLTDRVKTNEECGGNPLLERNLYFWRSIPQNKAVFFQSKQGYYGN